MKLKLAIALLATAAATPALADPIKYTLSGSFSGINGGPFTDVDAVFTGLGDTDNAYALDATTTVVSLSSFSAVAGGLTYTFTTPISFFVNNSEDFAGFVSGDISSGFVRFFSTAGTTFSGYDGVSSLGATPATFYTDGNTGTFNTDRGDVLVTDATNLVFSADVTGAVPEPATWGLMILGFGAVGATLRRRSTKVAFAA